MRAWISALTASLWLMGIGAGSAAEYTWAPQARSETRVDDNIRVRAENGHGAWGFDTGAGVALSAKWPTFTSLLTPRFNVRRFAIGDNLDSESYFVDFNNAWSRETLTSKLDFSYSRDSTLVQEATDIGALEQVKDRDSIRVNPSLDWTITERWSAQASFLFNDVAYLDAENTGLTDYRYVQGSTGGTYAFDATTQFFGTFFVSDFETPDTGGHTRSYGVQTGASKVIDPTLSISAAGGYIRSDIEFTSQQLTLVFDPAPRLVVVGTPGSASSGGPIASVTIRKDFEGLRTEFDYVRQVSPSGRGAQSSSDEMSLRATKDLSRRLSLVFLGSYEMRATEADQTFTALDRDLTQLRGDIRYRLSEEWTVNASYRFRHRESARGETDTRTADSNAVFLSVNFNGNPHTLTQGF